jgi:hypothetical protein
MYSFKERMMAQTVQSRLRRIGDLTVPNRSSYSFLRTANRHNRTIPTLVCTWGKSGPEIEDSTTAITKDIGDEGVGLLVAPLPLSETEVLLAYLLPGGVMNGPWFFRGKIQHTTAIGGGFWSQGVAITELPDGSQIPRCKALCKLTERLLPRKKSQ